MSLWDDLRYRVKKSLLFVYGPADLDTERDPSARLDREHDEGRRAGTESGKDWDKG
ncbi:MAG: hypothetical protein R2720_08420 [Candidatus Nanopelagicales bacterium]